MEYKLNKNQFTILSGYCVYKMNNKLYLENSGLNLLHMQSRRFRKKNKRLTIIVYFTNNSVLYYSEFSLENSLFDFYKFMDSQGLVIQHFIITIK